MNELPNIIKKMRQRLEKKLLSRFRISFAFCFRKVLEIKRKSYDLGDFQSFAFKVVPNYFETAAEY